MRLFSTSYAYTGPREATGVFLAISPSKHDGLLRLHFVTEHGEAVLFVHGAAATGALGRAAFIIRSQKAAELGLSDDDIGRVFRLTVRTDDGHAGQISDLERAPVEPKAKPSKAKSSKAKSSKAKSSKAKPSKAKPNGATGAEPPARAPAGAPTPAP